MYRPVVGACHGIPCPSGASLHVKANYSANPLLSWVIPSSNASSIVTKWVYRSQSFLLLAREIYAHTSEHSRRAVVRSPGKAAPLGVLCLRVGVRSLSIASGEPVTAFSTLA